MLLPRNCRQSLGARPAPSQMMRSLRLRKAEESCTTSTAVVAGRTAGWLGGGLANHSQWFWEVVRRRVAPLQKPQVEVVRRGLDFELHRDR